MSAVEVDCAMESVLPICRICLNACNEVINFQANFECRELPAKNNSKELNYLECLRLCTNLPLEEDDGGPQCLCTSCEEELQVVFKFLQKAETSQAILSESSHKHISNKETVEHTEISIEKFVRNEAVNDFEDLANVELASDSNELSNDSNELSNDSNTEDEKFDTSEIDIDIVKMEKISEDEILDTSVEDVRIAKMDKNNVNEFEQNESTYEIEYLAEESKASQNDNNTRIFISKKYKCNICDRSYTTERLLKVHLNYHKRRNVGSKPYSCKICLESFALQRYLTQHITEHQDCREVHKCQYCDKEYISKTALISHKRVHQEESFNCNECGKQFNGSYELSVHLRFHKREKEHGINKCKICKKEYSSPRYLALHMVVHLDDRKLHKCNYCNKEYVSKYALNNHKRLHKGQTKKCNECGKEFTRDCELKIHMRFHTREYPFECTICDKKFAIKGHLRTHMWQHQGIKLECDECGKLFGSTKSLNEHSFTHGEMPYTCDFCNKGYPSKQKYRIHLEKVHCSNTDIDLSQIESLTNTKSVRKHKKFNFVQIVREPVAN